MTTALLSTTYFGPVQWYQKLHRYDRVLIERCESFQKQTYRNRCIIAAANGPEALTVPVEKTKTGDENSDWRISSHGNWRHLHWQALQSAYGDSPFFEYYEDDLRPFFTDERWTTLHDFNDAIIAKMCELIDIQPRIEHTTEYVKSADSIGARDFRTAIQPKHPLPDADFEPRPYYQVFSQRHGFIPNLSILDLLFNMGPESILFL